jgi:hypothetical protein
MQVTERNAHVPLPAHEHERREDVAVLTDWFDMRQELEYCKQKLIRQGKAHGRGQRARTCQDWGPRHAEACKVAVPHALLGSGAHTARPLPCCLLVSCTLDDLLRGFPSYMVLLL